ncbi:MAG: phosphoesterase [Planctomycetota bacterium]
MPTESPNPENILVIPASVIDTVGAFTGFQRDHDAYLQAILNHPELGFKARPSMEQDPSFKQLIPYVVIESSDAQAAPLLFAYTRGSGAGESRLHAKRSIGIGGHIDEIDAVGEGHAYENGMQRELDEEVTIESPAEIQRMGLIYDPSTPVGTVHLGIVHRMKIDNLNVRPNEDDICDTGFVSLTDLRAQFDRLETWSQLTLDALYPLQSDSK